MLAALSDKAVAASVARWVDEVVIDLDLCPFARRERIRDTVRFSVTRTHDVAELLETLSEELALLQEDAAIETTLLIHPDVLVDFRAYNDFLDLVDELLRMLGLEGVFQVASFHPDYQFAGTAPEDPENYTNRAPFPVLHILREASLEAAIARHPDVDGIPERNIAEMNRIGAAHLGRLLQACRHPD